ncbi:MAG: hypothetical protein DCC55_19670 [Chloroflexi bacterium]|nr:MAG: hypothetical protein DCC55_19670 [Chloroflexota bacterium]
MDLYRLIVFAGILAYTILFTRLAFHQHLGMRTHRSDLGQIDQAVWNSSRGRFVENTDAGFIATRMTDHVEPILALISPVFYLWNDVRALLLLQVIFVAVGAWPLYELALRKLNQLLTPEEAGQIWHVEPLRQLTRPLALSVALAYLLAPQLQSAVLTEFHAAPLAVPLILWAFWAVETRRLWQFAAATILVAAVKEEMALLAAGLGIWALWRFWILDFGFWIRSPHKSGPASLNHSVPYHPISLSPYLLVPLSITLLSLAWFYVATFVIVPAHAVAVYGIAESGYFARYGALGDSPLDILKSFFTRPGLVWGIATEPARVSYLVGLLTPFGFLSLLAPEILLLALPVLLANLLSAYPAQYYGEFHYSAPLVPYFAVSAAYGLARLWRWGARRASGTAYSYQHLPAAGTGTMALASLWRNSRSTLRPALALLFGVWILSWAVWSYTEAGRGPLGGRYDPTPVNEHHRLLPRFLAQIPADAAVTATAAVHPHVSHRRYVYQFPLGLDSPVPADWALLDVTTNTDMAPGDLKARVDAMLAGDWGVVDAADGFLLLQRGATAKTIPDAFYDFARVPASDDLPVDIGLALGEVYPQEWPRWRQTQVISHWAVGAHFDPAVDHPELSILNGKGEVLYTFGTATPTALLWYPPAQWRPGEVVRITTPTLYLPRLWQATSGVGSTSPAVAPLILATFLETEGASSILHPFHPSHAATSLAQPAVAAHFLLPDAENAAPVALEARLLHTKAWPGGLLALWLRWQEHTALPPGWSVFVHLRRQGETITQGDGPPSAGAIAPPLDDFRELTIAAEVRAGETLTVVGGLYDQQTGQRASVLDATDAISGNELIIGQVQIIPPPVPDQACALIPATCASQPLQ